MITLHHLGISQSERILWLLEELGIEYKLVLHERAPMVSPESLTSIQGNRTGKAPFIEDSDAGITMSESAAICEYIVRRYGNNRLTLEPSDPRFPDYVYWFHYANGSFPMVECNLYPKDPYMALKHHSNCEHQPAFSLAMLVSLIEGIPSDSMVKQLAQGRLDSALKLLNDRLEHNKWLAGDEFTIADIMTVYTATTQRYWGPNVSYRGYAHLLRWLKDCAARPAYQSARQKGDPDMKDLIGAEAPEHSLLATGGVNAKHWRK